MKKITGLVLIVCLVFIFSACSVSSIDEARIEGSWTSQTKIISGIVTETTFTFGENGMGSISTLLGINISMTYSLEDGQLVMVTDTPILKKTFIYDYEISKSEMILTDSNGEVITFERID